MNNCPQCSKEINFNRKFCNCSCAAKYNNSIKPKRLRTLICKTCKNKILSGFTYCDDCITSGKHVHGGSYIGDRTIGEELLRVKSSRVSSNFYTNIRKHAKSCTKDWKKECFNCKYQKHVEICHIKPISSFPEDTKISKVNEDKNLILLCPNCHWELDNNILKL